MEEAVFQEVADLALQGSGQLIPHSRAYLVEARLAPILRREGFSEVGELMACLKARPNSKLQSETLAALTSKQTSFFRDKEMLERIAGHLLPMLAESAGEEPLRIWCAGGAAGHEAYSLAIMLEESEDLRDHPVEILSTDISEKSTNAARAGKFNHFDVQKGLSIHRLLRHFSRLETGEWQVSQTLAKRVAVRTHNLLHDASGLGEFDIILCRNVISGMAQSARAKVLLNLARQLNDGGVLVLGQGESATGMVDGLEPSREMRGAFTRKVARNDLSTAAA
ncbi:protein-glutamate O-methyltransferase CheR [Henriciella sp.]|uniref:CheR family methyltransferase n=1 Tax=Henriciella sp. TaxID=1968823 RepID=UPI00262BE41D|nr:protein-glutamate O-methyltransferase CheR [Henriciella sp.]